MERPLIPRPAGAIAAAALIGFGGVTAVAGPDDGPPTPLVEAADEVDAGAPDAWFIDPLDAPEVPSREPNRPPPPPMPDPREDFRADQAHFGVVNTEAERAREAEIRAGEAPVVEIPDFERYPAWAWTTQASAGVFGAGVLALLGGSVGNAISEAEDHQPLGGVRGPAIGGAIGAVVGTSLGVWGGGLWWEKPGGPWWTTGGAVAGAALGAGVAAGFIAGMGEGDAAVGLAVSSYLLSQLGGALLFNEFGRPVSTVE